jgi:hypothetical protein
VKGEVLLDPTESTEKKGNTADTLLIMNKKTTNMLAMALAIAVVIALPALAGLFEECLADPAGPTLYNTCAKKASGGGCMGECYTLTRVGCGSCYPDLWWCNPDATTCVVTWIYGTCVPTDCPCQIGQGPGTDKIRGSCTL